jgi:uncharacterized protein (UPF0218 family)
MKIKDCLGQEINVGDYVVYDMNNQGFNLQLFIVDKMGTRGRKREVVTFTLYCVDKQTLERIGVPCLKLAVIA